MHNITTHENDGAGIERVTRLAATNWERDMSAIQVLSHVEHPNDDTASITTVMIEGVYAAHVEVYVTHRDLDGGSVTRVSVSNANAAA